MWEAVSSEATLCAGYCNRDKGVAVRSHARKKAKWVTGWVTKGRALRNIHMIQAVKKSVRVFLTAPIGCIAGSQNNPVIRGENRLQVSHCNPR